MDDLLFLHLLLEAFLVLIVLPHQDVVVRNVDLLRVAGCLRFFGLVDCVLRGGFVALLPMTLQNASLVPVFSVVTIATICLSSEREPGHIFSEDVVPLVLLEVSLLVRVDDASSDHI